MSNIEFYLMIALFALFIILGLAFSLLGYDDIFWKYISPVFGVAGGIFMIYILGKIVYFGYGELKEKFSKKEEKIIEY